MWPFTRERGPLTPEKVKALWQYMSCVYGSHVVNKNDSSEMNFIASALGMMGVINKEQFMNEYTTTIGKTIYVPFEIGDASKFSLLNQVIIAAHEHQHIVQSNAMGDVNYSIQYLTSKDVRTKLEAEAYRSALEIMWWYNKTLPNISAVANVLRNYAVDDVHVVVAETVLRSASRSIMAGAILNPATKTAINWLNANL